MITKYGLNVPNETIDTYLHKLKNQIFKLLPLKEENGEWSKFLETLLIELNGIDAMFLKQTNFISLIGKLEQLNSLQEFHKYRKTIFECINLVEAMKIGD